MELWEPKRLFFVQKILESLVEEFGDEGFWGLPEQGHDQT